MTIYSFFLLLLLLYKSKISFCNSCRSQRACLQSVCGGAGKGYQSKIGLWQFVLAVYYQNIHCFVSCALKAWCIFSQHHGEQIGAVVWHTASSYLSAEWQQRVIMKVVNKRKYSIGLSAFTGNKFSEYLRCFIMVWLSYTAFLAGLQIQWSS